MLRPGLLGGKEWRGLGLSEEELRPTLVIIRQECTGVGVDIHGLILGNRHRLAHGIAMREGWRRRTVLGSLVSGNMAWKVPIRLAAPANWIVGCLLVVIRGRI